MDVLGAYLKKYIKTNVSNIELEGEKIKYGNSRITKVPRKAKAGQTEPENEQGKENNILNNGTDYK